MENISEAPVKLFFKKTLSLSLLIKHIRNVIYHVYLFTLTARKLRVKI